MNKRLSFKTFLISQIIIFAVSLILLGILYLVLNSGFKKISSFQKGPVTIEPISFNLTINNPDDGLLVFDNTTLVSGKTAPKTTVVISTDTDTVVQAGDKGEFSKIIDLNPGPNKIIISTFDSQGNNKSETRTIYYSEEKL